jgi:hypothetical protein
MIINEISRGITHIEDLGVKEFLDTISHISEYEITEKVDGSQILFGIDSNGFYTSRETKGGTRIYAAEDYGVSFQTTYMRSAHALLEHALPQLKSAGLKRGDQVEAEVLYGELPNVVPYSKDTNYLIFLRTTEGTVNIDRLKQKLDGQSLSIALASPFTNDGKNIELREETNTWNFSRVPVLENTLSPVSLSPYISKIEKILNKIDPITQQPIGVLLETPLNKIPVWLDGEWKEIKEHIKREREYNYIPILEKHIKHVKEILLNSLVRNRQSGFGPLVEDGGWIEGVVLRHRTTGKMVKLVDKEVFGTIREAAWEKRNSLTEKAKGVSSCSSFMGRVLLDMATAIGHPELGTMQAKNYLRKAGTITEDRINTLSTDIDFNSVKSYWVSLLNIRESDLSRELDKYASDVNGPGAVRQRTLETFALTFEKIKNLRDDTLKATDINGLFIALVGKQLGDI